MFFFQVKHGQTNKNKQEIHYSFKNLFYITFLFIELTILTQLILSRLVTTYIFLGQKYKLIYSNSILKKIFNIEVCAKKTRKNIKMPQRNRKRYFQLSTI